MIALPAIAVFVVALVMVACRTTNAVALTEHGSGYVPVSLNIGIAEQNQLETMPQFFNLALGFHQQVIVRHADTPLSPFHYLLVRS